jgi:hypothetical protein
MNPTKVRLCKLFPATDPQGNRFLKGRIGDLRIIVVKKTAQHEEEGEATHEIFLLERNYIMDGRLAAEKEGSDNNNE